MNLTKAQIEASMHFQGPCLVLAVPGAGKTTVLLHRIENLINYHGVDPKKILSITFSKAQANDMKSRYKHNGSTSLPHFSTIHSYAYNIVRAYAKEYKVMVELIEGSRAYSKYSLIKRIYYNLNKTFIKEDTLENFFTSYSYMKNSMVTVEEYIDQYKPKIKNLLGLIEAYEGYKHENNLIDFDDMLTLALTILKEDEKILRRVRNAFEFVQVDEAQDTSKVQIEIIRKTVAPTNNLFLVADDDQSIYGFRGANPQTLLNFDKNYDGAKIYFMEENFRSYEDIINASKLFITKNKNRYKKNMVAVKGKKYPISLITCKNAKAEHSYLLSQIEKNLDANKSVAVLYRNNISGLAMMDILNENEIDFYNRDKSKGYLSHFIIEDVLNILKLSEDQADVNLYEEIYYKLNAYLRKDYLNYLSHLDPTMTVFDGLLEIPGLKDYQRDRIIDLSHSFNILKKVKLPNAIEYIEKDLGYGEYLNEKTRKSGNDGHSPEIILESLKLISKGMKSAYDLEEKIEGIKKSKTDIPSKLTLSTVHSSKGLEFDNVYIIDLIEGEFPSSKSQDLSPKGEIEGLEEERRLFYVAMTRAKEKLTLFTLKTRNNKKVQASQFFKDIKAMKNLK